MCALAAAASQHTPKCNDLKQAMFGDFPTGPGVKTPPSNAEDAGSIPG